MKELFYEIINEAYLQNIIIDGEEWPIGFNTIIYDANGKIKYSKINEKNLCSLVIKNEDEFFDVLEEYLILERKMNRKSVNFLNNSNFVKNKMILSYLFVNATANDFVEPILFVKRMISYLKDNTFDYLNSGVDVKLGNIFDNNILEIKNEFQDIRMETPKKISLKIKDKNDDSNFFEFPSIHYGISTISGNKECYIYSILNSKISEQNSFNKKIKRKLYKVNKESKQESDFGTDYDEDDLSLVTPSAVISLTIFLNLLKKNNIRVVKGISFLPLRYLSRSIALEKIDDRDKRKELFDRNIAIQNNVTDKFLRTFRRICYNLEDVELLSDPYSGSDYLTLVFSDKEIVANNELLNEISDSVKKIK